MANIELVIKIPEDEYKNILLTGKASFCAVNAIEAGIPIPKSHGRLIDENYLLSILKCEEYETCTWRNCSDCNREKCIKKHMILGAPTIIEADKVGSEERMRNDKN